MHLNAVWSNLFVGYSEVKKICELVVMRMYTACCVIAVKLLEV